MKPKFRSELCCVTLALSIATGACTGTIESSNEQGKAAPPGGAGGSSSEVPAVPSESEPGGTAVVPTTVLDDGRVVLRRLNRTEYDNTMRDLLGSTSRLAKTTPFAADDVADGFDTIGQNLVMSLLLAEQLDKAATTLVDELFARSPGDAWRTRLLPCEPTSENFNSCATQILAEFMKRAYRRPVDSQEVEGRVTLASEVLESSGSPVAGLSAALKSVLLSPHFLYRIELGDPNSPESSPLSDHELATRLAYFLWASMPDTALMDAADAKKLTSSEEELSAQVRRLLADPKSEGFIESFAGQWLSTRDAAAFVADAEKFPAYDDALRLAMPQETNLFFQALITEEQPLSALMLADFTFVNDRLARHYGLSGGKSAFTRTNLAGTPRLGILGQTSVLAVTSYPGRTSPVRRADWVLEHLLCDPPPPAPPMIPALPEEVPPGATLRETFEAHRKSPACAACHLIMDPIGFALEGYDAIGSYRTMDNGAPVDTGGQLADGTPLKDAKDLAEAIVRDADYAICIAKHTLTFAVGRSFSSVEAKAYAAGIGVTMKDASWPAFLEAIVQSEAFRTRRGETP